MSTTRQTKREILGYWGCEDAPHHTTQQLLDSVHRSYARAIIDYDRLMLITPAHLRAARALNTVWGRHFGAASLPSGTGTIHARIGDLAIAGLRGSGTGRETGSDTTIVRNGQAPERGRGYAASCKQWGAYRPYRLAVYNLYTYRGRAHWAYVAESGRTVEASARIWRGMALVAGQLCRLAASEEAGWHNHEAVLQSMRRRGLCDWGRDAEGIYGSLSGERYHLPGVRTADAWSYRGMLVALRARVAGRRRAERNAELDAEIAAHGYRYLVTVSDSIASGNCPVGTESFRRELVSRYGLDTDTLPVDTLLFLRRDDFTRRAARVAVARQLVA